MQTKKVLNSEHQLFCMKQRFGMMRHIITVIALSTVVTVQAQTFRLNTDGYFNAGGTDVMAFSDFYPEGHQGGVCVIMNG